MNDAPATAGSGFLLPGTELGPSAWITITQEMIRLFGQVTMDPDPMHVDPDWARANGPYGGTISFGFLTLALLTHMLHEAAGTAPEAERRQAGHFLNYGFNRLRFVAPVRCGERVRGHFKVSKAGYDKQGRWQTVLACEVEIEGQERPALVAEWLSMHVGPEQD